MKKTTILIATIFMVLVGMSTQGFCQEDGIDACFKKQNGQLRIADSCRPPEEPISLVSREEFEALVERVEVLEEVDSCEGKGDECCTEDDKCLGEPAVCAVPEECKGVRWKGICVDNLCDTEPVNDDSACDENVVALDCGNDVILYCTGEVEQEPPTCSD